MQSAYEMVDGIKVNYALSEKKGASQLVLLNGTAQGIYHWKEHFGTFAKAYSVLVIDLPGFCATPATREMMNATFMTVFTFKVMDKFEFDKVLLLAPGVVAHVGVDMAYQQPERIQALNIIHGYAYFPPEVSPQLWQAMTSKVVRTLAQMWPLRAKAMQDNYETTLAAFKHYQLNEKQLANTKRVSFDRELWGLFLAFFASYEKELSRIGKTLEQTQTPILISWGDADQNVLAANAQNLHQRFPHSELHIMAGVGHYANQDGEAEYMERVQAFLSKHAS